MGLMQIFDVDFTKDSEKSLLSLELAQACFIFKLLFDSCGMVNEIFVDYYVFGILHLHGVKTVYKVEFIINLFAYIMSGL